MKPQDSSEHKTYLAQIGGRPWGKSILRNMMYEDNELINKAKEKDVDYEKEIFEKRYNRLIEKRVLEGINKIYDKELSDAMTCWAEASNTICQPALTEEMMQNMLKDLSRQMQPDMKYFKNPYAPGEVFAVKDEPMQFIAPMPAYEPTFEHEMSRSLMSMNMYGHKIIQHTHTIYLKKQARTHRKKRINNKWKNRYGYIRVPQEVVSMPCMVGLEMS